MDIESARSLKEEIATRVVPETVAAIRAEGGFSITTFSLRRMTGVEPDIALGIAKGKGKKDVRLAVRIQRHSLQRSGGFLDDVQKMAKGEVDVRFIGRVDKHGVWYRSRLRPLQTGASIGHYKITAGTVGAFATRKEKPTTVILSNNHVLANENSAKKGDAIIQPGDYDGGLIGDDVVAKLVRWVPLKKGSANFVDAAIAGVASGIKFDPLIYRGIGKLAGVRGEPLLPGTKVVKLGRTTGLTNGRVTAIEVDKVVVEYDIGTISFDNQVEIEGTGNRGFSSGGDSGSLILDESLHACMLLFAGSERGGSNGRGLTYANPIQPVLDKLAIKLLTD